MSGVLMLGAAVAIPSARMSWGAVAPARFVRYSDVRPILTELSGALPRSLGTLAPAELERAWPDWIARHDADIRSRLERGDEDTVVNWMLFGTSFTSRPRAVLGAVESGATGDRDLVVRRTIELISGRLDDLVRALADPGTDERRLFARAFLQRKGIRVDSAAGRDAAREYLRAAILRVAGEQDQIDRELDATAGGDALAEFARRSHLFRTRGLSLDTSLVANYSVERALAAMKAGGVIAPRSVGRVAFVGPGLDFADKDVGFDFYPPQTVQPFAVLDALERLGLAPSRGDPDIVLLDISPRVIDHVRRARAQAGANAGYTLNLPLSRRTPWVPEVRTYWRNFGGRIGAPAPATAPDAVAELAEVRAVRARPSAVRRMSALDFDIVTDRLDGDAFDLVIATNVFLYYDALDQGLAMSNVEAMLKPGAFLLANIATPGLASVPLRPVDTTTTRYTDPRDGSESVVDFMVWFQARAK
jgi:SAM-dependent methyltransferase